MARTKETKMSPEQQEKMTQEVMASLQPSTYGKDYAQKHSSFFEEVENSDLEVVTENVAATTSCMEDELTNEAQSPPNPQKRISGKQRKATLEEYQQTFLQVPRIDDRKPVFVSSDVRDRLDRVVRILGGRRMSVSGIIENIVRDACNHPVIGKYVRKVQFDELMQTLNLPMDELKKFAADVLERFDNPYVEHQVTSIMLNSFPKYQTRDLPGLKTYLERKGELPKGLVLGLAAIITYYKGGVRADGAEITPNDAPEIMQLLKDLWATGDTRKVAEGVLAAKDLIWGEHGDLNAIPGLTDMVTGFLNSIQEKGMLETVKSIL